MYFFTGAIYTHTYNVQGAHINTLGGTQTVDPTVNAALKEGI